MQGDCNRTTARTETYFPLQGGRRPVVATGAAALPFETGPAVSHLEKYAGQSLASRTLRKLHSLA
jgi:hypothetical protein